ncbi:hypothetical protein ACHZ97_14710 [Lysobacter soli]|uniref:hypothetical protein n=1 Tax=Lysobacter soli TaxID=453783 RepID=UPI0037CB5C5A
MVTEKTADEIQREGQVEAIEAGGCAPPVFIGALTDRQVDQLYIDAMRERNLRRTSRRPSSWLRVIQGAAVLLLAAFYAVVIAATFSSADTVGDWLRLVLA